MLSKAPAATAQAITSHCLVCGGPYQSSPLQGLVTCARCGFVSTDVELADSELEALYGKGYFHGEEYLNYVEEEESLRQNFRERLKTLRRVAPDLRERDLFEIGCAYGFFLDEVKEMVKSTAGIDISDDAVRYAHNVLGVNAQRGDYLKIDLGRKFDLITMWDTIEHLKRPDLFLAKVRDDLRPNGLLAITTGDIGSLNARLRGRKWRMIHPPTHLHYFSLQTMRALLHRFGFETVHISHPGISRNLRAILYYVLVWRTKKTKLYDAINTWRLFDMRISVNFFDIMYVIARRS